MKLKIIDIKQETPDVTSFVLEPQEPTTWKAGQYFHYVLHHEPTDERGSDRWFTISAAPYEGHAMITTRFTPNKGSSFKKKLQSLTVGKSIEISSLAGDFVVEDVEKEYVFIAGGIGITPFRAILKQLENEGKQPKITLLYANRDEYIVFKEELEEIAKKNPHFSIQYILSPKHIDETTIREFVPDIQAPLFYISGPEPMVDSLGEMLKDMGVTEDHIKQDWFPGYPAE